MADYAWIEIEDYSGSRYGNDRPLDHINSMSVTDSLNDMGSFNFSLPLDGRDYSFIQPKRFAKMYTSDAYGTRFVGMGIIENITRAHDSLGQPELSVQGNGMLRELQYHYIDDHEFRLEYEDPADTVEEIWSIVPHVSASGNMFCEAFDENTSTCSTASALQKENPLPTDWVYVSSLSPFDGVAFDLGSACNTNTGSLRTQYYNSNARAWETIDIWDNNVTTSSSQPFGQSGCVRFSVPLYWGKLGYSVLSMSHAAVPWCGTASATWSGCTLYQTRFWITTNNATPVDFAEVKTLRTGGTPDALDELAASMTTAPSWAFYDSAPDSAYTSTCNLVYAKVSQQNVYEVLTMIAEQTGENFRWHNDPDSPRQIEWLRFDSPRPNVQVVSHGNVSPSTSFTATEWNWTDANINLVHRIVPYGGGYGEERVDLEYADTPLRTGFSYWAVYGVRVGITKPQTGLYPTNAVIKRMVVFPDIVARSNSLSARREAANELALRACEWLRANGGGNTDYDYTWNNSGSPNMTYRVKTPTSGRSYNVSCLGAITDARVGDVIRVELITEPRGNALTTEDWEYRSTWFINGFKSLVISEEFIISNRTVSYSDGVTRTVIDLIPYRLAGAGANAFTGKRESDLSRVYGRDPYHFSHAPGLDMFNTSGTGTISRVYVEKGKVIGTAEKTNTFSGTVANPTQIVVEGGLIVDVTG